MTDKLGLQDCTRVRDLEVFVECDPSHQIFHGFRVSIDFFTDFSSNLLAMIVQRLPSLDRVTFNRHGPSVQRDSELMSRLQEAVLKGEKRIAWAQGKWADDEEDDRKTQSGIIMLLPVYIRSLTSVAVGRVLRSDLMCMREAIRSLAIEG